MLDAVTWVNGIDIGRLCDLDQVVDVLVRLRIRWANADGFIGLLDMQ